MLTFTGDRKPGTRPQARLFIPDFIYFSWFIQTLYIIQMKVLFLEQRPSGSCQPAPFPLSWDQTPWAGFALGFYLCPSEHIPVFYSGFWGGFHPSARVGMLVGFCRVGVFCGRRS